MDERRDGTRWVLGFDGGSSECHDLAWQIVALAEGKLTAQSLNSSEVAGWQERALGLDAAYEPALFAICGDVVKVWTGPAMAIRVAQRVGPASGWSALRLLRALQAAHEPDEADDPSRRRASEFTGKAAAVFGLAALERGATPDFAGAQVRTAGARDAFKDVRLEVAKRREQARLAQRWKLGREERAFAGWLDDQGYRPAEGGKLFFFLVYRKGRLERRVVAQAWQKGKNEGAVVLMSLEGNREVWKGLTFERDDALLRLSINRSGKVDAERLDDGRRITAQQETDSAGCNTCEVLATLIATGAIVVGNFGCWVGCAAGTILSFGIATVPCVSICIALGTVTVVGGAAGARSTCEGLNYCP